MDNIKSMKSFLEAYVHLDPDSVDYHGQVISIKSEIEGEQKKLDMLSKVDQLNEILRTLGDVIQDLHTMKVNTDAFKKMYYELASAIKSLE